MAAALGALVAAGLGVGLLWWNPGTEGGLARTSYDVLHRWSGVRELGAETPVLVVYLDLASYRHEGLDPLRRWPRELHARLLRRLTRAGARAVIFDVLFDEPGDSASADADLAAAIREHGRVVLAAEHTGKISHGLDAEGAWARSTLFQPPRESFAAGAAGWGVASLWVDDDLVVRHHLAGFTTEDTPSLAWAAARCLGVAATAAPGAMEQANSTWIRYYGPAISLPHASYSEVLEDGAIPDERLRDRIVWIGARPVEGLLSGPRDEFRNPYHSWRYREYFMPGVEVHATQLLNLIQGEGLSRWPLRVEWWVLLVVGGCVGGGLTWLRPLASGVAAVLLAAGAFALSAWSFERGLWFPWMLVTAIQVPAGFVGSICAHSLDWYRTRRRLEAARRADELKIREQAALIETAHDAILVQNLEGEVVYANPSAERLYGWKLADLQRPAVAREWASADAAAVAAARTTALAEGEWTGELRQQTATGRVVTVDSRWTRLRHPDGRPKALLVINTDVTERQELEAQFLRTQRLHTIGSLAGGMAHDLNNALAPIMMAVELLRRRTEDSESRRLLAVMEAHTQRGADMVRQVLLFARGRGGDMEPLELGPLVRELERMLRETFPRSIAVEAFIPKDLWPVRGNPTQLHQVLLNLCVNARDAMPHGGRLTLAADNLELGLANDASGANLPPGPYVSVLVSDTGAGMSPEVQARLFEPFFTTKPAGVGTGIGLSTVQRILRHHGGGLRVESTPGEGSTFEIFLPRGPDPTALAEPVATDRPPRGRGEWILVVDDEQAIRQLMAEGLEAHGYRVLAAADGAAAVALFDRHASDIQLVITDTLTPALDGPATIRALRERRPDVAILRTSAGPSAPAEDLRALEVLPKPFALEDLLIRVARSLPARPG